MHASHLTAIGLVGGGRGNGASFYQKLGSFSLENVLCSPYKFRPVPMALSKEMSNDA
jgi:hypothetical protein